MAINQIHINLLTLTPFTVLTFVFLLVLPNLLVAFASLLVGNLLDFTSDFSLPLLP